MHFSREITYFKVCQSVYPNETVWIFCDSPGQSVYGKRLSVLFSLQKTIISKGSKENKKDKRLGKKKSSKQ